MKLMAFLQQYDQVETVKNGLRKLTNDADKFDHMLNYLQGWIVHSNNRAKTRWGQCSYSTKVIELNTELYAPEMRDELIKTLLHEVAHAVTRELFNECGHGWAWRRVMLAFGQTPNRCGPAKKRTAADAKHVYMCKDCGIEVYMYRRLRRAKYHVDCQHKLNGGAIVLKYSRR